jgi:hypothetical protein
MLPTSSKREVDVNTDFTDPTQAAWDDWLIEELWFSTPRDAANFAVDMIISGETGLPISRIVNAAIDHIIEQVAG